MRPLLLLLLCLLTTLQENIANSKQNEPPGGNVDQRKVAVGAGEPVLHGGAHHPAGEHPRGLHQAQSHPDLGGGANAA